MSLWNWLLVLSLVMTPVLLFALVIWVLRGLNHFNEWNTQLSLEIDKIKNQVTPGSLPSLTPDQVNDGGSFEFKSRHKHPNRDQYHSPQEASWRRVTKDIRLIAVHLPKTAGSSFDVSLREVFGSTFLNDSRYSNPLTMNKQQRQRDAISQSLVIAERGLGDLRCIHGHFMPIKYLLLAGQVDLTFVTWMRHPVDRLISHYFFIQRMKKEGGPPLRHFQMVVEEKWSLEQFCFSENYRNLYSQFLWGFPLHYFSFIGITEHYQDDLQYFADTFLGSPLQIHHHNVTPSSSKGNLSSEDRARVEEFHAQDMILYRRALTLREERSNKA